MVQAYFFFQITETLKYWLDALHFFILLVISHTYKRAFSHDVTAAMLVFQTSSVGVDLFLMQTLSFVPINLQGC